MLRPLSTASLLSLALLLGACATGEVCSDDDGSDATDGGSDATDDGSDATDGGSDATDGGSEDAPSYEESLGIDMVELDAGTFTMGCTAAQEDTCEEDEQPAHDVWLTRAFAMSATEITQAQYQAVVGSNPSGFDDCEDCPVERIDWLDAVRFANELSLAAGLEPCYDIAGITVSWPEGLDCEGYRLPTEAEWEYAARAGGDERYAGGSVRDSVAWSNSNAGGTTQPVGGLSPNAWGLYDMSGNVWEWTWDTYDSYEDGPTMDPVGAAEGDDRNGRGGAWDGGELGLRVSDRHLFDWGVSDNWLGMRVARTLD